ncbi:MAG: SDR family NAD(P)-dependent oxidoreductase, partial [Moorea sp. SIO2I5]|nr:SDR family NAD(P)-dependent oxidoreductase [Moorena sp. SIO2I5]
KGYDENIINAFKSYDKLGKLLKKGLANYVLLAAKKQEIIPEYQIYHLNQEKLNQLLSYSEVSEKQWIYELKWEQKTNKQKKLNLPSQPGVWLIFSNENDTQQLKIFLEQQNKSCVIVTPGSSYKQLGNGYYQVNPTKMLEFKQLIKDVLTSQNQLEGVVHLWSLNTSIENLETSQELGCASVLHLVQAMGSDLRLIVPLWLVTQGTQNVDIEKENQQEIQVQQAPIWGLGRVIALEHPDLNCRRVDLDRTNISLALEDLTKELLNPDGEDQIAIRKEKRYVARLVRRSHKSLEKKQQIALKTEVSYLVTGGLGALGLEVAQWMVKQGARHIVLNSRRNPSEIAHKTLQELQQTGAKISVVLGDVSKEEDVANILKQIQESQPPLRGVIHAAGVLDDGVLQNMTWERFDKVLAPKLQGAWHLHNLTQKLPLEFFVCFSSITSLLGSSGQGNYAAANAFMDALAYHRQSMGLPGLTINWGGWQKGGMAVRLGNKHQSRLLTTGMNFIPPEKGVEILGALLLEQVSQVGVFPINWSRFAKQLPGGVKMPCIEAFYSQPELKETNSQGFLNQLVQTVENERKQLLIHKLQTEVGSILGLPKSKLPDPELGFFSLGIDSLMAVEIRNILNSTLNSSISTATLFEKSNIKDLAEYLIEEIFPEEQDQEDGQDNQTITTAKNIETQFEGEIDSAIASELEEIQALLKEEG